MSKFLEAFGIGKYTELHFWKAPRPEGQLFYFTEKDIQTVKENMHLEGDRVPSTPDEIVEAATNKLGTLIRTDVDGAKIEFFIAKESLPFAEITLDLFAGVVEEPKPEI